MNYVNQTSGALSDWGVSGVCHHSNYGERGTLPQNLNVGGASRCWMEANLSVGYFL
jgi:hypothetical protein